jgi:hypothetical protein
VKSLLRRRPSPAMIVALIALFVALGGVSYGFATGEIDSREIKNNDVRSRDIRNNEIRTRDLRNNEVRGIDIRNSTVQGRDIALNTVTGDDVREDTLQKVPSALLADTATKATSADSAASLDRFKMIDVSMSRDVAPVTLASNGPLTLLGNCNPDLGGTNAGVTLDTSENNTLVGQPGVAATEVDAADMPAPIGGVSDTTGDPPRSAIQYVFHATAPSGAVFTGNVSVQAESTAVNKGNCRFQGFVALPG